MWAWIKVNWERCFSFSISLIFLFFSVRFLLTGDVTGATAAFVMFFLCLIYVNVARFKRFKGFGFEAELWEDKQREAADLIDRLKNIVQVYTRELVMMKVLAGRWGVGSKWIDRWALYEELVAQHDTLGQKIDFSPLREEVYRVMVYDIVSFSSKEIQKAIRNAQSSARAVILDEFGDPITDIDAHHQRLQDLNELDFEVQDLFSMSKTENVARFVSSRAVKFADGLREKFGVEVKLPEDEMKKLEKIDALVEAGDFCATPELMQWADRH